MTPTLVLLSLISYCVGGKIGELDYQETYGYAYEETYGDKVILRSKGGHVFKLNIEQYRDTYYSSDYYSSGIDDIDYKNIIFLYYDNYLLEQFSVPSIEELEECQITKAISSSVKPVIPDPEEDSPNTIRVYYSMTDGSCRCKVYEFNDHNGQYYTTLSDKEVDSSKCN